MVVVESLHHVAVIVTDIEAAKDFYGRILGLQEIDRPNFPFDGAWYQIGSSQQLHLIVNDEALTLRGSTKIDGRDGHLALRVADYDETVAALQREGVQVVSNPDSITGWAQAFVCDPDGNVIELNGIRPADQNDGNGASPS